jgi:hypothetical protein
MATTLSRGVYVIVALAIWFIVVGMVIPALGSR